MSPNSTVDLFRANSGANFPYLIPNMISINKSVISAINSTIQQYYYFFNWSVFDAPCESERSEVKIIIDDCEIYDLSEIIIYPNPNQGVFNLLVPKDSQGSYKVFNILGQQVYEQVFSATAERVLVSLPNLSKGVYNLVLEIDNEKIVEKITISGR